MNCIRASIPVARPIATRLLHGKRAAEKGRRMEAVARPRAVAVKVATAVTTPTRPLMLTSGTSGRVSARFSIHGLRSMLLLLNSKVLLLLLPFRWRRIVKRSSRVAEERQGVAARVPAGRRRRELETAARRGMAIRRLRAEEECVGDDERGKTTAREFAVMVVPRGDAMFTQSWTPSAVPTKGVVVLLHGLNEHSGRYDRFATQLNDHGFKVCAMDWIGHGGSDDLHGYVPSIDFAVSDLKEFLEKVLAENPGLPCFCFGHSTGAAIILKAVLDPKIEASIQGVVLTSPAIRVQPSHPIVKVLAPIFSFLAPTYQIARARKRRQPVSRDPEALRIKYSDPLVFTGSIRIRTGYEILRTTFYLQQNLRRVSVPFLVLHGTADMITDPKASQSLYDEASSMDKKIKLYKGFLHDLLFEPERDEIAGDIISWLSSRLDSSEAENQR